MDLQRGGLEDLEGRLRTAISRISELQAGMRVTSDEFFSDPFMCEHTQFRSFPAFCEASPWSLERPRTIQRVNRRRLDAYVAETTDFESWEAMKTQAAEEEIIDQAVSDVS
ncbi:hypothetical protein [Natrinema versiforme]|uniref:Uncharacterized protein n=1 Tax=Natrinema versiforme TaxID=88724 RepID=A0A4P8WIP8_9EURY|nr:hypothetical protein [Natrinema versiforme]QCS43328.1 hypothetical protein FEJ81_13550 [Natrinema versiforme]